MIRRVLIEDGGNRSLFGEDDSGRPYRADEPRYWTRRLLEGESDRELMRSASPGAEDSPPNKARQKLLDNYTRSLEEGDFEASDEYHRLLKAHHKEQGAADNARPATTKSRESRDYGQPTFRVQRGRTSRPRSAPAGRTPAASDSGGWMARLLG